MTFWVTQFHSTNKVTTYLKVDVSKFLQLVESFYCKLS
jgi:hypothetical protein